DPRMNRGGDIADLHLVAAIASRLGLTDIAGEIREAVIAAVIAGRGVGPEGLGGNAEQAPDPPAPKTAPDVPEGDIHTGEAGEQDALAAVVIGLLIDLLPEEFRAARIEARDQRLDLLFENRPGGGEGSTPHGGLAPAEDGGIVGMHLDQHRLAA